MIGWISADRSGEGDHLEIAFEGAILTGIENIHLMSTNTGQKLAKYKINLKRKQWLWDWMMKERWERERIL